MASLLAQWASKIAAAGLTREKVGYGPWQGSMRSRPAEQVPRSHVAGGTDYLYKPAQGWWKRRGGTLAQFDATGLLPAKWGAKCRQADEFSGSATLNSDGIPTVCALLSKETIAAGLDDGRFSTFWVRDQSGSASYTLASEFSGTTYPAPGSVQNFRYAPLWYDSGDGGISRGVDEFQRRLLLNGSRAYLKANGDYYFPSVLGTPSRWDGERASASAAAHLMPSGPIPPTHCGYITTGTAVAGTTTATLNPIADVSTGGWTQVDGVTTANLYSFIDELGTTADPVTDDSIRSYGASTNTYTGSLSNGFAGFSPQQDDTVKLRWKARRLSVLGAASVDLAVTLLEGATSRASSHQTLPSNSPSLYFEYSLTPAEIAAVTDWSALRFKLVASGGGASEQCLVEWFEVEYTPDAAAAGGWKGKDRFPFALAYRYKDDSVWSFTTPRFPSSTLVNGLGIYTVNSGNADQGYDKLTWHLPVPPAGFKSVLGLRGTKIDSSAQDDLAMNLHDMRITFEVDAGTLAVDDFNADDDAPYFDADKLLIHEDHIMTPRTRWLGGGDSRACASYGGLSPAAIEFAVVGRTADWDAIAETESTAAAYGATASYWQIVNTGTASTSYLRLVRDTGAGTSKKDFAFDTYATLQDLVDAINATSASDTWTALTGTSTTLGAQWRAQVLPGQNPQASTLYLCPTVRTRTACTVAGQAITRASALSTIPVGAYVTSSGGGTDGAYISAIGSDGSLTFVGTLTAAGAGSATCTFVAGTGDTITGATHGQYEGYVRVIGNAVPGFLYFTKTYLAQFPIEKDSVWMTSANPESSRSAPNCFSGNEANKHRPPFDVGMAMGVAGIRNGFLVPFAGSRGARIRNIRDGGTGYDRDYHMIVPRDAGCIGPVVQSKDLGFVPGPEGWYGMDLESEDWISDAIYQAAGSDATTGTGDFAYEGPLSVAAAKSDTDTSYLYAKVMRQSLWVNYRSASTASTHPDRQVVYDFSASHGTGLKALRRDRPVYDEEGRVTIPAGVHWGWSLPLVRAITCMCEGHRSDGSHLYGWNDTNQGSAGDGRIDEMETDDDADNGGGVSAATASSFHTFSDTHAAFTQVYVARMNYDGTLPWTANGVVVSAHGSNNNTIYADVVSNAAGTGCAVAWVGNQYSTSQSDVAVQLFDAFGVAQWGSGTRLTTATATSKGSVCICTDASDGYYVGWVDASTFVLQRVNASGAAQWGSASVVDASTAAGASTNEIFGLIPDGSGGVYVYWKSSANRVRIARYKSNGTAYAGFSSLNAAAASIANTTRFPVCAASSGKLWVLGATSTQTAINLISTAGAIEQTSVNSVPLASSVLYGSICADAAGGCFVAAEVTESSVNLIRLQRFDITAAKTVDVVVTNTLAASSSTQLLVLPDGTGGCIVVWQFSSTAYAQRFDSSGVAQWAAPVSAGTWTTNFGNEYAVTDGANGVIIAAHRGNMNTSADAYAVRLDSTGAEVWAAGGVAISTQTGLQKLLASAFATATDNSTPAVIGSAISASLTCPYESLDSSDNITGQEIVFEHSTPAGATVNGTFTRSLTGDSYTCTPDVGSTLVVSVYRWVLSLAARVHSAACYVGWTQTAGAPGELRRIELIAARVKDRQPGTSG